MNKKLIPILIIILFVSSIAGAYADLEHGASVDALNETVEIEISESGSKNFYGIDNIVGAKNKIINDKENKDYYEIKNYELDDGTTVELIYPNGKQNNANKKEAIVNGTKTTQPRVYGRDGVTHIKINYDSYIHSEETVNYINEIGGRTTTVNNNLGKDDTWSQDGAAFDNQISGLEKINTTEGTYTFNHWEDKDGNIIHDFFIAWENGAQRIWDFFAVYDFTPWPAPEPEPTPTPTPEPIPVDPDNETIPANETIIDNETVNDTNPSNESIVEPKNTDNGIIEEDTIENQQSNIKLPVAGNGIAILIIAIIVIFAGVLIYCRR